MRLKIPLTLGQTIGALRVAYVVTVFFGVGLIVVASPGCARQRPPNLTPAANQAGTTAFDTHLRAQVEMLMVNVLADRVMLGTAFIPRRLDLPQVLAVPAGMTVTAAADSTWDYVEVGGTLRIDRTHDTTLRFTTLVILPGGTFDMGTPADPIPAGIHVTLIVRDIPIDTSKDPYEWGNGLVNAGGQRNEYAAAKRTPFVSLAQDPAMGATSLTLATPPTGWQVGDELIVPDTAFSVFPNRPRRESTVTIASVSGTVVTLSKGLDFAHPSVMRPYGALAVAPIVANVTRDLVIKSENPFGTRGHTVDVGDGACWDLEGVMLLGLGRTTVAPLDDTTIDATTGVVHIGTNPRARYAEHAHHAHSHSTTPYLCKAVDNVYRGIGNGKWGRDTHGTHDTLLQDNIAIDFPGAGFMTEDGYEVRNRFVGNLAMYNIRQEDLATLRNDPTGNDLLPFAAIQKGAPGTEGTGFWMRGVMNYYERNQSWDNYDGFNLFNQQGAAGFYPSAPGVNPPDVAFNPTASNSASHQPFLSMVNNTFVGNMSIGLDVWGVKKAPNDGLVVANSQIGMDVQLSQGDDAHTWLRNPIIVGAQSPGDTTGTTTLSDLETVLHTGINCLESNGAYDVELVIEGGYLGGCGVGVNGGLAVGPATLTGTTFQNAIDLNFWDGQVLTPTTLTLTNVTYKPLGTWAHRYIIFTNGKTWDGTGAAPDDGRQEWLAQDQPAPWVIHNWQGDGQDYLLFKPDQLGSLPAYPAATQDLVMSCPDAGLTNAGCEAKYGMAYGGMVLPDALAVPRDGVVNGFVTAITKPFGPPLAVLTFPTAHLSAAGRSDGTIQMYGVLTGNATHASRVFRVSIDGGPSVDVTNRLRGGPVDLGDRTWIAPAGAGTQGAHTVQTWRVDANGVSIPSSARSFTYAVGVAPPSPPPPPPPTTCQDPKATNVGAPLPCMYPQPPPTTLLCSRSITRTSADGTTITVTGGTVTCED